MNPLADNRLRQLLCSLETLATKPATVLCAVLAVNSLTLPYAGLVHDARLYAAQVSVQVAPETFEHDLYLLHGSQDRFTLFSLVIYPVVALLGLPVAFLVLYLASKALFFWGAQRLIQALVKDPFVTLLSLLFLSMSHVTVWGNEGFHLNESFLTPRIGSCAFVFLALERMLRDPVPAGWLWQAALLLAGAFLLHPLMAMSGGLTLVLWSLSRWLRWHTAWLAGVLMLAAAVILVYEPLGTRLFGHMDEEWRAITLQQSFYFNLYLWRPEDWLRIAAAVVVLLVGMCWCARDSAPLLLAVLATAVIGAIGSVIAVQTHYLLLIQGQPYRAMWLLEFLAMPLACLCVVRLWQLGTCEARCASLLLAASATSGWGDRDWLLAAVPPALFLLCVLFVRRFVAEEDRPRWLWSSALILFLAAIVLPMLEAVQDLRMRSHMRPVPVVALNAVSSILSRLPLLLLACAALGAICGVFGCGWRLRTAMLGVWGCYPALLLFLVNSPRYGENFDNDYRHLQFVKSILGQQQDLRDKPLTIYFPAELQAIWFGLRANSYFHWAQMSGCAFNRGTAIEGKRRATLVRNFEATAQREWHGMPPDWRSAHENFFHMTGEITRPTTKDLLNLCQEDMLDFVVIQQCFDGLYLATDGTWYVYDCNKIRSLNRKQSQ